MARLEEERGKCWSGDVDTLLVCRAEVAAADDAGLSRTAGAWLLTFVPLQVHPSVAQGGVVERRALQYESTRAKAQPRRAGGCEA